MSATPTPWPPSPSGFDAGDQRLPSSQPTISMARRERAAIQLLAIIRGATPEELADGPLEIAQEDFSDPLVANEALTHVDMLLVTLLGSP